MTSRHGVFSPPAGEGVFLANQFEPPRRRGLTRIAQILAFSFQNSAFDLCFPLPPGKSEDLSKCETGPEERGARPSRSHHPASRRMNRCARIRSARTPNVAGE